MRIHPWTRARVMPAAVLAVALLASVTADATAGTIIASVAGDGAQANADSGEPAIAGSGASVAFTSAATNLVPEDHNAVQDVFVYDRPGSAVTRVSVASGGAAADGRSIQPALSQDGATVAFSSLASNLVAGDTNGTFDVFVHDRTPAVTTRVSVASGGAEADGRSIQPALSQDGATVAFSSLASNLVAGDTNGATDVFVHDRMTGETSRISVSSDGAEGLDASFEPSISANGRWVAFSSLASNLVAGDTNGATDVFVHDRMAGETSRVSVDTGGGEVFGWSEAPAISGDGRFVVFHSFSSNLVPADTNGWADVFVHDLLNASTSRVSVDSGSAQAVDGASLAPSISESGSLVAFWSRASTLVPEDFNDSWDVFIRDRGPAWCPDGARADGAASGPTEAHLRDAGLSPEQLAPVLCPLARSGL